MKAESTLLRSLSYGRVHEVINSCVVAESTLLRSSSYGRVHEVINSCVVAESTGVEPVIPYGN